MKSKKLALKLIAFLSILTVLVVNHALFSNFFEEALVQSSEEIAVPAEENFIPRPSKKKDDDEAKEVEKEEEYVVDDEEEQDGDDDDDDDEEEQDGVNEEEEEQDGDDDEEEQEDGEEEEQEETTQQTTQDGAENILPMETEYCNERESVLLENLSEVDVNVLKLMARDNLCLSFHQQKKFFIFRDKVIKWIRSQPEKEKDLLYGPPGKNLYAVILNEKYAFRHIFKNGGTAVNSVTGSPHVKLDQVGDRSLVAAMRDPIDHFLSGWAECGFRFTNPDDDPSFSQDIELDERIQNFVSEAKSCLGDPHPRKREICLNISHAYPQSVFLLDPNGGEGFDPSVDFVGHLGELGGLLKMVGFGQKKWKSANLAARSASGNVVKAQKFPKDQKLLSDETLRLICEFVILDYYLFDFEPPAGCLEKVKMDMSMIDKVSFE